MRFTQLATVRGVKKSKGDFDGVAYDTTKVFIDTELDDSKGNARGVATVEHTIGTSAEYEKYISTDLPFKANMTFEMTTTGKATKVVVIGFVPELARTTSLPNSMMK